MVKLKQQGSSVLVQMAWKNTYIFFFNYEHSHKAMTIFQGIVV